MIPIHKRKELGMPRSHPPSSPFSRAFNPKSETCPKTKGQECREAPLLKWLGGEAGANLQPGPSELSREDRQ